MWFWESQIVLSGPAGGWSFNVMFRKSFVDNTRILVMTMVLAAAVGRAGTFGTVVSIGGEAADLALDEPRGVLYVADFTGSRIDVISLTNYGLKTSINVPNQPSSISVSADDHWLIIAHYGNNAAPASQTNMISLLDLTNNYARQTFTLSDVPLGVAFGLDGNALIVTASSFQLFNPTTGSIQLLESIAEVATNAIPQPLANYPPNFTQATVATSRDGLTIAGFGGGSPYLVFRYSVATKTITSSFYTSSPAGGPRVVSLADNGSTMTMAWWLADSNFNDLAEFLAPSGILNIGSHVIDSSRNLVYAQVPSTASGSSGGSSTTTSTPILQILSSDNLTVQEQIQLPENLAGRSVLSSDHNTMYSISTSGVTVLPVGSLNRFPRLTTSAQDVAFRGNFCNRNSITQTFVISDPGGNPTRFAITPNSPGIIVSPSSGTTPAVITVSVDPNAFAGQTGTVLTNLTISSPDNSVIDISQTVRVAIGSPQPAQRGVAVDIPGNLVDLMADPKRPAYYVARQDQNQILVFNSANNTQSATLRTCTKPTSMAITVDQQYLLVGCDASHVMPIYDLDLLQQVGFVSLPSDYVESIAVSNNAILAYTRSAADGTYGIDQISLLYHTGSRLPQLGLWSNGTLASQGILSSSANGANILYAGADGGVLIYSAVAGTFVISRSDYSSLAGSAAASNFGQYVVGSHLLDNSGAPVAELQTSGGQPAGFAFINQAGYFTTAPATTSSAGQSSAGTISQIQLATGNLMQPTPMVEAPLLGNVTIGAGSYPFPTCTTVTGSGGSGSTQTCFSTVGGVTTSTVTTCNGVGTSSSSCSTQTTTAPANTSVSGFSRTIALLNDQSAIINLTTSGLTVLPWTYSAAVSLPQINSVVSAADGVSAPAPGGLIEILGTQFSPTNLATNEIPLPTALANSCVTVNGQPVPLIFVSLAQINAQMPSQAEGDVTVQVLTPGGTSDNFNLVVPATSPAIFLSGTAGPVNNIPTVIRNSNSQLVTDSNPVQRGDNLTIYLTGCGQTTPQVANGAGAPMSPLALAVSPPVVTLGGVSLNTMFGGLTPGSVGLCQINVSVPANVPEGLSVPLTITQGAGTQTLSLRVIG
jgi:uncharacterized protein (TIGR03437 family)